MLQAMREGAHSGIIKFVLFGLLILGVAGLVLMDVNNSFRSGFFTKNVAEIKKVHSGIGINEFGYQVQNQVRKYGISTEDAYKYGLVDQVLMQELAERLMFVNAHDLGIRASEKDVASFINENLTQIANQVSGQTMTPKEILEQILASSHMKEKDFVELTSNQLSANMLRTTLASAASVVPDYMAEDLISFAKEERDIDYIIVDFEGQKISEKPSEEDIESTYSINKEQYAIPETRAVKIALITADELKEHYKYNETDIENFYNDHSYQYQKDDGSQPPLKDVYEDVKKDFLNDAVYNAVEDTVNAADDFIAGGGTLEEMAKELNLKVLSLNNVKIGEQSKEAEKAGLSKKDWATVLSQSFELNEGEASPSFTIGDSDYAILSVEKVTPKSYKPLEEVKSSVKEIWLAKQQQLQAASKATKISSEVRNNGKSIKDIAKEQGYRLRTASLTRAEETDAKYITNAVKASVFSTDNGKEFTARTGEGYVIGKVTEVKLPEKIDEKEKEAKESKLSETFASEFIQAYLIKLYDDYNVKINRHTLDRMYLKSEE